jgi:hypothetical protein
VVAVEDALAQGTAYDASGAIGTLGSLTQREAAAPALREVGAASPSLTQAFAFAPTLEEVLV